MGVVILRGGIATPAVSSAGPATSGAGAGVSPGGNEKSCTLCCAASGAANSVSENMFAKRCRTGFMAANRSSGTCAEYRVNPTRSRPTLALNVTSRQQRGMSDQPSPQFLGKQTELPASPEQAQLDYVPNPREGTLYLVRFAAPEFTSLCPVTGQPDFAHLVIDYAPGNTIVESKSLKLFLGSFRNHNGFHEDVTVGIGQRLAAEMKPKWLRIGGYWYPRGGIPIDVFWQSGPIPEGLWVPEQGVQGYRGRG